MGRSRRAAVIMVALVATACGPGVDDADRFEAAATVALPPDTLDLDANLGRLQDLIAAARESDGDELFARVREAEAVTDRLLETQPPVAWLPEQYSLDATLRQFQAAADRIVALLRRGASPEDLAGELGELAASVAHVRQVLREGTGVAAPADLDSLLADSVAARRNPAQVFGATGIAPPPTSPARDTARPALLGASTDSTDL